MCLLQGKTLQSLQIKKGASSDEVEKEVNLSRPGLRFDYTKRMRAGDNGRLLSFIGKTQASIYMSQKQKDKIEKSQNDLDRLIKTQRSQKILTTNDK